MNEDQLLRSFSETKITSAIDDHLSLWAESDLFTLLGQVVSEALSADPPNLNRVATYSVDDLTRDNSLQALGTRIFIRWGIALHDFACAKRNADEDIRSRLFNALTGTECSSAVVAGIIVSTFGLSPATAAIIGAIAIKVLVVPAGAEICSTWDRRIKDLSERYLVDR